MLSFKDFWDKQELLEEFDAVALQVETINEANMGDLDIANVIMNNLDKIPSINVRQIIGAIVGAAKFAGKKLTDVVKLFSKEGMAKIRKFIENDILGTEEIKYIRRKFDKDRYKGYKGFEQFLRDMKEDNPTIYDSLIKAVNKLLS